MAPPTSGALDTSIFRFGDWVRQLRRDRGETQDTLGQELGFSKETIRSVESRYMRPSRQFVNQLLRLLDVAPDRYTEFERFARNGPVEAAALPAWIVELARPERPRLAAADLPSPATRLVGRLAESTAVRERLRSCGVRLLNLVGAPGVGKTRLAVSVANEVRPDFAEGVHFVSLADVVDPHLVPRAICGSLTLHADEPPLDTLRRELRDRHALVVLDNLEQVAGVAPVLSELLGAAPRLKLLVTSRHVLRVYGEHALQVPPLELPDLTRSATVAELSRSPSVELFVERGRAVDADLRLTDETALEVAEICHRLDGLPLAIELAAARCRALPPAAILKRLDRCLDLLVDGPLDQSVRQQTLRGALDWSYALLCPAEKTLFARLAVFEHGCTPAAASALLGDCEAVLEGLVEKSLLHKQRVQQAWGDVHYKLLRPVREYALERLNEAGELEPLRARHAAYVRSLAA